MDNEAIVQVSEVHAELSLARDPQMVVRDAERAATLLTDQVFKRIPPPIINGKKFPEVEHWQTVASFYGVFASIESTRFVRFGDVVGFEAAAEVEIPGRNKPVRAEAMCLTDEPRWKSRPLHQLRAMAETRAISRVLRNIFSRVMVLAGCEPTPAEDDDGKGFEPSGAEITQPRRKSAGSVPEPQITSSDPTKITRPQVNRLYAIAKGAGWSDADIKSYIDREHGIKHSNDIPRDTYEPICNALAEGPAEHGFAAK
jgi:hypothetical protein